MATDYRLSEQIEELDAVTAGGDYLLSAAVPPDEPVGALLERVEEAHAEAEYLDSESVDEPAREALERLRHLLHDYEESGTPDNGLVCYVGVVDGDLREWAFDDLPSPVEESTFVRDSEFDTNPLARTTGEDRTYGLLVVERGGAALGRLDGERVDPVETIESQVMGKTKAGGQSAQRFARERERQKEEFFGEVGEEADRAFLDGAGTGQRDDTGSDGDAGETTSSDAAVDGLLVGGSSVTVDDFLDGDYLDHRLRDAVVGGQFSVEYAGEQGLEQLVERARDALDAADERPARETLDDFFDAIGSDDPVVYGREKTDEALEYGAVETTLVSQALPASEIRDVESRTSEEGGETVVVPDTFDRGVRFRDAFDGVGALLRFDVE